MNCSLPVGMSNLARQGECSDGGAMGGVMSLLELNRSYTPHLSFCAPTVSLIILISVFERITRGNR